MLVTINGEREAFERELSVSDLLADRRIESRRVAVEINEDIVPRKTFAERVVRDGDRIEIVTFVGGG